MQSRKFKEMAQKDVKQLMDQVKEEFVYFPDKRGTLDDWGKHLFGVGKFSPQETLLKEYLSGNRSFVVDFQKRQIELATNLYALHRFSSADSPVAPISTLPEEETAENAQNTDINVSPENALECAQCLQEAGGDVSQCPICQGTDFRPKEPTP